MKIKEELNDEELAQVAGGTGIGYFDDLELFSVKGDPSFISIEGKPNTITCEDHQK